MTEQQNLLLNPAFHYGMPAMSAAAVVAIAVLVIDDQLMRTLMVLIAVLEMFVTPRILKRAARENS